VELWKVGDKKVEVEKVGFAPKPKLGYEVVTKGYQSSYLLATSCSLITHFSTNNQTNKHTQ
jgi:hypothetical protein